MDTDDTKDKTTGTAADGGATGAPADGSDASAGGAGEPGADQGNPTTVGKNLVMTGHAFGKALRQERERGKRAAVAEREKQAKDAGFASAEAMFAHMRSMASKGGGTEPAPKKDPPKTDTQTQQPQHMGRHDRKALVRFERENDRLRKQLDQVSRAKRFEERKRREAQQRLDAQEARAELEKAAISSGVKKVDYVVHLLEQQLEGKSEDELKAFDETKFFAELRGTDPHLFGETIRPATTGTGAGNAPPAPKPGQATKDSAAAGQIDAKTMNREDYEEHLRKRGINPHALQ